MIGDEIEVMRALVEEYHRAQKLHLPYGSLHEGHSVIEEEFDELWDEIKGSRDPQRLFDEAIQVASTAFTLAVFIREHLIQKGSS